MTPYIVTQKRVRAPDQHAVSSTIADHHKHQEKNTELSQLLSSLWPFTAANSKGKINLPKLMHANEETEGIYIKKLYRKLLFRSSEVYIFCIDQFKIIMFK